MMASLGVSVRRERTGPGNVAMAGAVEDVAALVEDPAGTGVEFAKRKKIGSNILMGMRKPFFGNGKLVHERKTKIVFFGSEIDFEEAVGKLGGGFPADLATKA